MPATRICYLRPVAFILLFWLAGFTALAQPGKEALNNSELRTMQYLLDTWRHKTYLDESGEPMEQQVRISEPQRALYIYVRPFREDNMSAEWLVVHRISLPAIDSISMNYRDSLLVFHTREKGVGHFHMGSYLAATGREASLHARLPEVRNLSGQLLNHLRYYQQQKPVQVPGNARQLVSDAVYNYLSARNYNSAQVAALDTINALFIGKCQICEGSRQGFRDYAQKSTVTEDATRHTFDLRVGLFSGTIEERLSALEKLVSEAVKEYYTTHLFSESVIQTMQAMLSAERKKSMTLAGGKKCASCDGACTPGKGEGNSGPDTPARIGQ